MEFVVMTFQLTSPAFQNSQPIPKKYTADGQNASPSLKWTEPPAGTKSFAMICEDPDAPRGTFTHWLIFNLPVDARELAEGVPPEATGPDGSLQGTNDFGKPGYGGPSPPPGKPHRYIFKLLALDQPLNVRAGAKKDQLLTATKGHILAETQLTGTYGR
jgi:Raf kinase inhibitor-like YbhB/YbcL family protein